ncbi:MAG TPA: Smr/MutS family protein [Candidatus Acidoferrales bacterium]|nr:Smr/MutS family protein [Candidatus Acidoferrales bacterium]
MARSAEEILEFDQLRALLRARTTCAPGRGAVESLGFRTDRRELEGEFALIAEAMAYLRSGEELGFGGLADPEAWLERLTLPGAVLAPAELLDAASAVDTITSLREKFRETSAKFPLLSARSRALPDLRFLAVAVRRAILPGGEISDSASLALRRLRDGIGRTRETLQKTLERILRSRAVESGEDYITQRNERYVIPVRASERRTVQGVMHAASATGQTVFVEPLETVEINNQLVQLREEETAEIARILEELTGKLVAEHAPLAHAVSTIAEMDAIFARARFAREYDCCVPEFTDEAAIALDAARHPVLESALRPQGRPVVPLSLSLGKDDRMLVISGPNTGGKTVALKTVGLAVLAAQSAIPVAAQAARLGMFDRVLADIGDEQSIAADLSTFSAHVLNIKSILGIVTPNSLVLVDEMGTGTAPEEGAALAVALLEEFRARGCLVLATTHHDRLKAYASTTEGVLNAAVEFDEEHLAPTYRLRVGVPGGSSGIMIAQRLGLAKNIVERAQQLITPEAREAAGLIAYLHHSHDVVEEMQRDLAGQARQLEAERRELRDEWVARQRSRIAELESKFAAALEQYERQMAHIIEAVKERELRAQLEKQSKRKFLQARSEARSEADAAVVSHLSESQADLGIARQPQSPSPEQLVPGARVRVRGLPLAVVLRRRDNSSAEIEAGPLRMKIPLSEITEIVSQENAKSGAGARSGEAASVNSLRAARGSVTVHTAPADRETTAGTDEINVIGCTVEEASRRVDKFIDGAALAGKPQVRVIHGHGTGALRRGLTEFLSAHPLVENLHPEAQERGGTAVTVVELRA